MADERQRHGPSLRRAIRDRRIVRVVHKNRTRLVEPYLVYASQAGELVLHGRQIAGDYETTPPPDWCNLRLSDLTAVRVTPRHFVRPHPDYNPRSPQFHRVLAAIPAEWE